MDILYHEYRIHIILQWIYIIVAFLQISVFCKKVEKNFQHFDVKHSHKACISTHNSIYFLFLY